MNLTEQTDVCVARGEHCGAGGGTNAGRHNRLAGTHQGPKLAIALELQGRRTVQGGGSFFRIDNAPGARLI